MKAPTAVSEASAAASYDRLLRSVAHEIRGPVGVAWGALDQLEADLQSGEVAINPRLFEMSRRGLRRALRLAERLSRVSELEHRPDPLPVAKVDLCAVVRQAHHDVLGLESRRGVEVVIGFEQAQRVYAIASLEWLRFAIGELICLAVRFARRKVVVLVRDDSRPSIRIESDGNAEVCFGNTAVPLGECSSDVELMVRVARKALALQTANLEAASEGSVLVRFGEGGG